MTTRPTRFAAPQRLLHWLMALCILSMLFIGVGMISVVTPKWLTLVQIHKPLGIAILVLALIRLTLRFIYGAPALPADLPLPIKLAAESSQYIFYALMIGMPLIGWGMLSASSHPVVLFGDVHLPPLLPVNPGLYTLLQQAHYFLAFAFFALILMHVAAILFHKLVRNDGVFEAMAPTLTNPPSEGSRISSVPSNPRG
jgi:cytochrome b561